MVGIGVNNRRQLIADAVSPHRRHSVVTERPQGRRVCVSMTGVINGGSPEGRFGRVKDAR